MPSAWFEPVTPATKRPQTYALDRATTGIGSFFQYSAKWRETKSLEASRWFVHSWSGFCCYPIAHFCEIRSADACLHVRLSQWHLCHSESFILHWWTLYRRSSLPLRQFGCKVYQHEALAYERISTRRQIHRLLDCGGVFGLLGTYLLD
jgi:hypothetical protein